MLEEACGWLEVLFIMLFVIAVYVSVYRPTPEPRVRPRYQIPAAVEQNGRAARISNELRPQLAEIDDWFAHCDDGK